MFLQLWISVFIVGLSCPALGQIKADRAADGPPTASYYGTVELRHHLGTYYDEQDYMLSQKPEMHARMYLGATFYKGTVDAFATLGVFKVPETLEISQRRPEAEIDIYAHKSEYFTLVQYNIVRVPLKRPGTSTEENVESGGVGTTYLLGMAPLFHYSFDVSATRLTLKTGFDGWTKFYSQRQYTDDYEADENFGAHFGLGDEEDSPAEEIEDYAPHYYSQVMAGLVLDTAVAARVRAEITGNYNSIFDPKYLETEEGVDYRYGAKRYSYYRLRILFGLGDRVSLVNDFYHFHDGLFAARRFNEEVRFRNILRLACNL